MASKNASEGQLKYIRTLIGQIDWDGFGHVKRAAEGALARQLTMDQASEIIDDLKEVRAFRSLRFRRER